MWKVKLKKEMKRGQELEDQLFKACEEVLSSPKQLQLLGLTQTVAQLKTKHYSKSKKKSEVHECRRKRL